MSKMPGQPPPGMGVPMQQHQMPPGMHLPPQQQQNMMYGRGQPMPPRMMHPSPMGTHAIDPMTQSMMQSQGAVGYAPMHHYMSQQGPQMIPAPGMYPPPGAGQMPPNAAVRAVGVPTTNVAASAPTLVHHLSMQQPPQATVSAGMLQGPASVQGPGSVYGPTSVATPSSVGYVAHASTGAVGGPGSVAVGPGSVPPPSSVAAPGSVSAIQQTTPAAPSIGGGGPNTPSAPAAATPASLQGTPSRPTGMSQQPAPSSQSSHPTQSQSDRPAPTDPLSTAKQLAAKDLRQAIQNLAVAVQQSVESASEGESSVSEELVQKAVGKIHALCQSIESNIGCVIDMQHDRTRWERDRDGMRNAVNNLFLVQRVSNPFLNDSQTLIDALRYPTESSDKMES